MELIVILRVWKNVSKLYDLTDGTYRIYAYAINVNSNGDVYVLGSDNSTGKAIIKVWKNSSLHYTLMNTVSPGSAFKVEVRDGDVYTAITDESISYVYKNDKILYTIPRVGTKPTIVSTFCLSGSDVYSFGSEIIDSNVASVWKNDQLLYRFEDDTTLFSTVRGAVISGGDLYAAGIMMNNASKKNMARVWKNKTLLYNLTDGTTHAQAESIVVLGNDVYVSGQEIIGSNYVAKVWKNGVGTALGKGLKASVTYSLFVK